ncbi:MAG: hypothetical protein ACD_46C00292G0002 [uncultured bacterium]|nr:MAG: hypothetical protein ACD_46C00292G0002 [uncultured bacterium]
MTRIHTVLFDLDGTLLDTAQDLAHALNQLRQQYHLPPLPLATIRPHVGYGAKAMLKVGMDVTEEHPQYTTLLDEFLNFYRVCLTQTTKLFDGIDNVLTQLENKNIPWGIVTNKPSRFTFDLLKALKLDHRAACIICGDSLSRRKPDPDQILHACELLKQSPENCLYIGDTQTDALASRAAGTKTLIVLYGYLQEHEDPFAWGADGYAKVPADIIAWLDQK